MIALLSTHKVENMYATFLVVSTTDDISSIKLPSFSEIWKANRGGGHRARESPFQMGSGAGTNGCGPDSDSPSLWKSFGDERGGFLPPTTPWVGPQFTESYHRLSFVFFRWIIIVIAPFHKAANQWPRVNGVKHSGFRVALPQHTHWGELCSAACVVGPNVVEVLYYAAAQCTSGCHVDIC